MTCRQYYLSFFITLTFHDMQGNLHRTRSWLRMFLCISLKFYILRKTEWIKIHASTWVAPICDCHLHISIISIGFLTVYGAHYSATTPEAECTPFTSASRLRESSVFRLHRMGEWNTNICDHGCSGCFRIDYGSNGSHIWISSQL